ncbi:hypothetical protein DUI87_31119 [Hirundo rustica rustica]|uniref:Uncharacterized protein n=1 Tax=Hirundo rustica rustica TaxID=333673 RepID=A0A3M0IUI4_HIRRU|nr:hypothetical protein DUI87_31119 [Hirundo rustica rustica]
MSAQAFVKQHGKPDGGADLQNERPYFQLHFFLDAAQLQDGLHWESSGAIGSRPYKGSMRTLVLFSLEKILRVVPAKAQLALSPVKPYEISMGPLLHLVQVPLDSITSLRCVNSITQLGIICKFSETALNPFICVINEAIK